MAISLKHKFQSAKADGDDDSLVRPSDWNDEHNLTLDQDKIIGRASSGAGNAEEITCTPVGRSFLALTDPDADRIAFWDDSAGAIVWLSFSGLSISGTTLSVDAATTSAAGVVEKATDAEVRAHTSDKYISADHLTSASAAVTLTDAATVAVDWSAGIYYTLAIGGNRTLGNPSNEVPGTFRYVYVIASSGTRTLGFGNEYGGTLPTLDDITTSKGYLLTIFCVAAGHFIVSAVDASPP